MGHYPQLAPLTSKGGRSRERPAQVHPERDSGADEPHDTAHLLHHLTRGRPRKGQRLKRGWRSPTANRDKPPEHRSVAPEGNRMDRLGQAEVEGSPLDMTQQCSVARL